MEVCRTREQDRSQIGGVRHTSGSRSLGRSEGRPALREKLRESKADGGGMHRPSEPRMNWLQRAGGQAPSWRVLGAHPCVPPLVLLAPLVLLVVVVALVLVPALLPMASGVSPACVKPVCSCCTTDAASAGARDEALALACAPAFCELVPMGGGEVLVLARCAGRTMLRDGGTA